MKSKVLKIIILVALAIIIFVFGVLGYLNSREVDYADELDVTVATVDGKDITFEDLAFYILYVENTVESQAMIYNSDSTKDYWNLHINGKFIAQEAKDNVLAMAVHDTLFYDLALKEEMVLDADEKKLLEDRQTDFWEDLFEEQIEKCPVSKDIVNEQIERAALAEKYQNYLGETKGPSVAAYKYDGYYYQQMLDKVSYKVNNRAWSKFSMGENTLTHTNVNYVNGVDLEDTEK